MSTTSGPLLPVTHDICNISGIPGVPLGVVENVLSQGNDSSTPNPVVGTWKCTVSARLVSWRIIATGIPCFNMINLQSS